MTAVFEALAIGGGAFAYRHLTAPSQLDKVKASIACMQNAGNNRQQALNCPIPK